jgi:hypothetical protein
LTDTFIFLIGMESPTSSFHGRGYKEEGGKEALIADGSITKSDPGPFHGNGSMDVCESCAGINYDELAELEGYVPEHGQLIMELGSTSELASSPCPVCRLFASVSPAKARPKETIRFTSERLKPMTISPARIPQHEMYEAPRYLAWY